MMYRCQRKHFEHSYLKGFLSYQKEQVLSTTLIQLMLEFTFSILKKKQIMEWLNGQLCC